MQWTTFGPMTAVFLAACIASGESPKLREASQAVSADQYCDWCTPDDPCDALCDWGFGPASGTCGGFGVCQNQAQWCQYACGPCSALCVSGPYDWGYVTNTCANSGYQCTPEEEPQPIEYDAQPPTYEMPGWTSGGCYVSQGQTLLQYQCTQCGCTVRLSDNTCRCDIVRR
jgi:hypothetical protein